MKLGVNNMTAAAIDVDTLNNLFDNQKKLDDIFNSIFDNEDTSISSSFSSNNQSQSSTQASGRDEFYQEEFALEFDNTVYVPKKQNAIYIVLPVVLEIAAIYYGIMYLI